MLYWPFVCATPTMHSPVYVNYLCCSWRQSATRNSPVMLCTSAWQKARWGGWEERRRMRRRWGRRLTPERTAPPVVWMVTSPTVNENKSGGFRRAMLAPSEDLLTPRWGSARLRSQTLRGREGYLCLRPTGAPTAPGDDSGYSHPGTHERPAAAGHRRQQQRECIGESKERYGGFRKTDSKAKTLQRVLGRRRRRCGEWTFAC